MVNACLSSAWQGYHPRSAPGSVPSGTTSPCANPRVTSASVSVCRGASWSSLVRTRSSTNRPTRNLQASTSSPSSYLWTTSSEKTRGMSSTLLSHRLEEYRRQNITKFQILRKGSLQKVTRTFLTLLQVCPWRIPGTPMTPRRRSSWTSTKDVSIGCSATSFQDSFFLSLPWSCSK